MIKPTADDSILLKLKKSTTKIFSRLKICFVIAGLIAVALIIFPIHTIQATVNNLCSQAVDTVLVIDRSGSMDNTSRCDWWSFEPDKQNPPFYVWVHHIDYNQTQAWCQSNIGDTNHRPVWLNIDPKKITAAKTAAASFVGLLGSHDQSAVISFANDATVNATLSNNHLASQNAINNLTALGATDIGDAIKAGIAELQSNRANPQANHVMILLTDGMANLPHGNGNDENPADVAYAQSQAAAAATAGFKIFTIGLGDDSEIDQAMLQNIAATTGAQYYHAPGQNDLQSIYNVIATRICQYGSIAGCKYEDANDNGVIYQGEQTIIGWPISLTSGDQVWNQQTDSSGCYKFSGLLPADYTLAEGNKFGGPQSYQTYPANHQPYQLTLLEGANLTGYHFANYFPVCGNNIIDQNEVCDDGTNNGLPNHCNSVCSGTTAPICGNGVKEANEVCDDGVNNGKSGFCNATCSGQATPVCGNSIIESGEQCDGANLNNQTCQSKGFSSGTLTCNQNCQFNTSNCSNGGGQAVCGNGIVESGEACDSGTANNGDGHVCANTCQFNPACDDGVDNDNDSLIDSDDPGCHSDGNVNNSASYNKNGISEINAHGSTLQPGNVLINEVMWMGMASSTTDEWLELKNTTANNLSLSGCIITDAFSNNILTVVDLSIYSLAPNSYFIISYKNTADSIINTSTHTLLKYLSLSNTNLGLKLICGDKIIDTAGNGSIPLAGLNGTIKKSMERKANPGDGSLANNWCTASTQVNLDAGVSDLATPAAANDCVQPPAICGNGLIESGETCDDGASNGQPNHCNSTCSGQTSASCGNGVKEGAEVCDDGNKNGQPNFCNSTCTATTTPVCGNAMIESGETCDDGTNNGTFGFCNANCSGQALAVCGNGIKEGTEECDDGNTISGDGCSNICNTEMPASPTCGNGIVESGEICDDGINNGKFGFCNNICSGQTLAICGNGVKEGGEVCDDGASNGQPNHCNSACTATSTPICGNSIIESGEQCDTTNLNEQTCTTKGFSGGSLACSQSCQFDTSNCSNGGGGGTVCGNNIVEAGEVCDDGAANGQPNHCDSSCTATSTPICGNGLIESGEQCDGANFNNQTCQSQGFGAGALTCSQTCQIDTSSCFKGGGGGQSVCGNSIIESGEQCDGQNLNNQTCASQGFAAGNLSCNQSCQFNLDNCSNGGGGGGGGVTLPSELIISNEAVITTTDTSATVTWLTNKPATSRVIYDTISHADISLASPPNYGYASSTVIDLAKVTGHSILIAGLLPNTVYYFRPLSSASPEIYGQEVKLVAQTSGGGQVLGEKISSSTPILINGLAIVKSVKIGWANPGQKNIDYQIIVTNQSNWTARQTVVTDKLPPGFSYANPSDTVGSWYIGDLAGHDSKAIDYQVNIDQNVQPGIYTNNVKVNAENFAEADAKTDLEVRQVQVLGEKLAPTGFSWLEFLALLGLAFSCLVGAMSIRKILNSKL